MSKQATGTQAGTEPVEAVEPEVGTQPPTPKRTNKKAAPVSGNGSGGNETEAIMGDLQAAGMGEAEAFYSVGPVLHARNNRLSRMEERAIVARKLNAMMRELSEEGGIPEDKQHEQQKFRYVSHQAVSARVWRLFAKHGFLILSEIVGVETAETKTGNNKTLFLTLCSFVHRFIDTETGAEIEVPHMMRAANVSPSGAIESALSTSLKYVTMKSLGIPTEDADQAGLSWAESVAAAAPAPATPPTQAPRSNVTPFPTPTHAAPATPPAPVVEEPEEDPNPYGFPLEERETLNAMVKIYRQWVKGQGQDPMGRSVQDTAAYILEHYTKHKGPWTAAEAVQTLTILQQALGVA